MQRAIGWQAGGEAEIEMNGCRSRLADNNRPVAAMSLAFLLQLWKQPMNPTSPFHAAALALSKRGCAVIPCKPRAKVPVLHGWQNLMLSDAAIDAWWEDDPQYNVGVATGYGRSGFMVVDLEMKKGLNGEADLRKLEEEHGTLPSTVEVITPNGPGRHIYLRTDREMRGCYIADGIEIKANGNQVLVPPSIYPDTGTAYQWSVDSAAQIADAPQWLLDLATSKQSRNGKAAAAPEQWQTLVAAGVDDGQRDVTIAKLAGHSCAGLLIRVWSWN